MTAAHTLIFTEWSNTIATIRQAQDRICRIGQAADRCLIYYLIVKDTIDEAPLTLLDKHGKDIDSVMDGEALDDLVDIDHAIMASVKRKKFINNKQGVNIEYQ